LGKLPTPAHLGGGHSSPKMQEAVGCGGSEKKAGNLMVLLIGNQPRLVGADECYRACDNLVMSSGTILGGSLWSRIQAALS
jgi:hypothetical protein